MERVDGIIGSQLDCIFESVGDPFLTIPGPGYTTGQLNQTLWRWDPAISLFKK